MLLIAINLGLIYISLPVSIQTWVDKLNIIFGVYYGVRIVNEIISYVVRTFMDRTLDDTEYSLEQEATLNVLEKIATTIVYIIGFMLLLQNLGFDISALIAGVGVGGIAIAFALQNVLEDIFATISIHFDKPFRIGEMISIGTDKGVVKSIGIKTSRLKSMTGDELIIPNKELTQTRIENHKRVENRRVSFQIGVTYDTNSKKLREIPKIIEEIIKPIEVAEFEKAYFAEFGNSSLIFKASYFINTPDIPTYREIKQKVNLELVERFEKGKIEFAFPSQTIYLQKP